MFDSSMAFEFAVLKPMAVPLLEGLPAGKYPEVDGMLRAFDKIEPLDEKYVAPDSLAREFIGGSAFTYNA
jgi:uridine kinase